MTHPLLEQVRRIVADPAAVTTGKATTAGPTPGGPTPDELVDANESDGRYGDGPDVPPVTEPARPALSLDGEVSPRSPRPIGSTGPASLVEASAFRVTNTDSNFGTGVRVVGGAGVPRRLVIRNTGAGSVMLYTTSPNPPTAATPDANGFELAAGAELVTNAQGALWAAGSAAWELSVWAELTPAPVTRGL